MKLPNAYAGVKKVFIAEILTLIGTACAAIGVSSALVGVAAYRGAVGTSVRGGVPMDAAGMGSVAFGGIFLMVSGILALIGLILLLVGLNQASKDEPHNMKKAFVFAIIALICSFLQSLFQNLGWWGVPFFNVVATLSQMCMMIFTIMGVSEVTQNISRQDVADMGPKILVIAVIALVASVIAAIIGHVIGGVMATIALVLLFIANIVFVVFLARATSALAQA